MNFPPSDALLLVTGSSLRAEDADRPLAYFLKEKIQSLSSSVPIGPVYVVSDFRYLYDQQFGEMPAISIGGPGVNAVTHKWIEELPVVLAVDDDFYVQIGEPGVDAPKACLWGMDHDGTKIAVATFVENHLAEFVHQSVERFYRI